MIDYSVSARRKQSHQPVGEFLLQRYPALVDEGVIRSVFAFAEYTPLYGGRSFNEPELSRNDLSWLCENGIGFRIPLSNLMTGYRDYKKAKSFLDRHHRKGNAVIVALDDLATWIRNDYPDYSIEASVIKALDNSEKVMEALSIFDTVIPQPTALADDFDTLATFPKERIRLFVNAGCMFTCSSRICYGAISRSNRGVLEASSTCSHPGFRFVEHRFDVARYKDMGFTKFKALSFNPRYPAF